MSDLNKMPPIFCIGASGDSLGVEEIDWTHSEQAASLAFTYGWVRASDAKYLVESIERLRAEVLEQARLLGMGAEREAKLLAEIERLRAQVARYRAGLKKIVEGDGFWDAPSLARDLLAGKDV